MTESAARTLAIVTDREDSLRALELLKKFFPQHARVFRDHLIGWQGGSKRFDVYWHSSLGIWGTLPLEPPGEKGSGRFWNCFGIEDPDRHPMLRITVEINPPHEGENASLAGVVLRDEYGRLYLGHSGRGGGGKIKESGKRLSTNSIGSGGGGKSRPRSLVNAHSLSWVHSTTPSFFPSSPSL